MAQNTGPCGVGPLTKFRTEYLDSVLTAAKSSEHLKSPYFEPVYRAIEKYVTAHDLIVSNSPGATVRQYHIFGARIFFHANDLAGEIADLIPYVRMNTVVREKEFEIHVDGVKLVWLYNIDPTFAKIIAPCASTAGELHKLPAEVELVDVYHRLYSPDQFKSWPRIAEYETELWQEFNSGRAAVETCGQKIDVAPRSNKSSSDSAQKKTKSSASDSDSNSDRPHTRRRRSQSRSRRRSHSRGGDSLSSDSGTSGVPMSSDPAGVRGVPASSDSAGVRGVPASSDNMDEHISIVLDWLKGQKEYAIVGNFALTCMMPGTCKYAGVIQIIVGNIQAAISSLTTRLEQFIPKAAIEVRKYDLQLPTDYRIKKHVIIARVGREVYYIANLFNCASFEMIPTKSATLAAERFTIGDYPVLLRFLFIELWFTRMVRGFGKMSASDYERLVKILFTSIDTTHAAYLDSLTNSPGPIEAPPSYIGVYINESISKKSNEMVAPYFPAQYKAVNGEYRDMRKRPES